MAGPHPTSSKASPGERGQWRCASTKSMSVALLAVLGLAGCSSAPEDIPGPGSTSESSAAASTSSESAQAEDTPTSDSSSSKSAEDAPASGEDSKADEDPRPASFEIPAIDATSELLHLGLRDNGTLDVPPGDPGSPASWYTGSPIPGEVGPAVLLGHVNDSAGDAGVFADLPELVEGDEIAVEDEDGGTTTFAVTKAEQYGKDTFPTLEVYGNTEEPELRLITCDGYNQATGEYDDNYVVYATMTN